jgi:cell division transport system permease protein
VKLRFILSETFQGLRRNLTMTFAVIITVAVSLTLFGAGLLVRAQVDSMKDYWYDRVEVSIFLCGASSSVPACSLGAVTPEVRAQIEQELNALRPLVQEIYYESKEEAYQRFLEQFKDSPVTQNVTPDALPESFRVKLSDPTKYEVIAAAFEGRPGVEQVQDQRQLLGPVLQTAERSAGDRPVRGGSDAGRDGAARGEHDPGGRARPAT